MGNDILLYVLIVLISMICSMKTKLDVRLLFFGMMWSLMMSVTTLFTVKNQEMLWLSATLLTVSVGLFVLRYLAIKWLERMDAHYIVEYGIIQEQKSALKAQERQQKYGWYSDDDRF